MVLGAPKSDLILYFVKYPLKAAVRLAVKKFKLYLYVSLDYIGSVLLNKYL